MSRKSGANEDEQLPEYSDGSVEDIEGLLGADERFLCSLSVKSCPRLSCGHLFLTGSFSVGGLQRGRATK